MNTKICVFFETVRNIYFGNELNLVSTKNLIHIEIWKFRYFYYSYSYVSIT